MSKSQTINIDEIFEILFQPAWLPCDVVREHIAAIVLGFSDFNQRILQDGGFYLDNSARERNWKTSSEKAILHSHELP